MYAILTSVSHLFLINLFISLFLRFLFTYFALYFVYIRINKLVFFPLSSLIFSYLSYIISTLLVNITCKWLLFYPHSHLQLQLGFTIKYFKFYSLFIFLKFYHSLIKLTISRIFKKYSIGCYLAC